jgi:hypothetical protein
MRSLGDGLHIGLGNAGVCGRSWTSQLQASHFKEQSNLSNPL